MFLDLIVQKDLLVLWHLSYQMAAQSYPALVQWERLAHAVSNAGGLHMVMEHLFSYPMLNPSLLNEATWICDS